MVGRILANLKRQSAAAALLETLLAEEFSHLSTRDPGAVASVEFSIQELLRQLAVERRSLHALYAALDPAAKRLADVVDRFDPAARELARSLYATIDRTEQRSARQASNNYAMALGLYDVTKSSLDNLQKLLTPKKAVYGSRGRIASAASAPGLINGRF
ncbi:flagellar export chaperone FlgN [Solidesulfovibrio sp.]